MFDIGVKISLREMVKRKIDELGLTQREFAELLKVTPQTVSNLVTGKRVPKTTNLRRLAEVLNIPFAEAQAAARVEVEFDQNVEPYSEQSIPEIPLFEAAVAAGHWTDVTDIAEFSDPQKIDVGRFRIRIRGDSMMPEYHDGQVVEFRCLRVDRDGVIVGRDYYVQHVDGEATFKRIEAVTEDSFILRALNRPKYPEPMHVERALVVRMAMAEAIVTFTGANGRTT